MAGVQSYVALASLVVHTDSASQGQDLRGETQDLESMFPDLAQRHVASWWCPGTPAAPPLRRSLLPSRASLALRIKPVFKGKHLIFWDILPPPPTPTPRYIEHWEFKRQRKSQDRGARDVSLDDRLSEVFPLRYVELRNYNYFVTHAYLFSLS